jgi:MFS family permease
MKSRLNVLRGTIAPASATAALPARKRSMQRLMVAECPNFWRLWSVGLVVFTVRWLETVAVGVFVYQHSQSALLVAMKTMLRLLPMGLFGAFIGAWAEKIERRITLIAVVMLMLTTSIALALLAYSGHLAIWHLAAASFLNGLGWASDNPVRRVMIGDIVGGSQMSTAMSLDVGANNASRMVGPTIGGLLLASVGIGGVFILSVTLCAFALYAAFRVSYRNTVLTGSSSVLARIAEGLRLARGDRRLIGTLVVTMIYNLFGWPFTSMTPRHRPEPAWARRRRDRHPGQHGRRRCVLRRAPAGAVLAACLVCSCLSRRGVDLHGDADRVRSGASARDRRQRLVADRDRGSGVQHHAGNTDLSRRAAGDAFAHPWCAVDVHRCRADRIRGPGAAGGCSRSVTGNRGIGIGWPVVPGADAATLAAHLTGRCE